jgi:hypothetical protein
MTQSQNALPLNDPLLEDSTGECFLLRRLQDHHAPVFVMDAPTPERIERYRTKIIEAGLDAVIVGRAPDKRPETYAQLFERLFNEPLQPKPRRERRS